MRESNIQCSVEKPSIHLIHIHAAPGKIMIPVKFKTSLGAPKPKRDWLRRRIGIVSQELNSLGILTCFKQEHCVIDRKLREPDQVHNRGLSQADLREQSNSFFFLMPARERKNHPPVAALDIASPRASTF